MIDNSPQVKNKTILHVIDTTGPGGAETVFIELADRMRAQGYRSIVVIRGPGWVQDELGRRGLEPIVIPAKGSFNFRFVWRLMQIIRREKVNIIQSHLLGSNIYSAIVGLLTWTPVIATFHGRVDVGPAERLRWLKLFLMNCGVKQFITVSQRLCDEIARERLLRIEKTTVIYNGIDIERYGVHRAPTLCRRLNISDDAIFIGSLGNVRPAKAYDVLIQSAPLVIRQFPNAHFVVAGDIKASVMAQLTPLIERSSVAANIHFLGFCNDSAAFLSELDVFLLCSHSEGFSISTIEAMASKLPVVVTRCGGPEEIVEDGVSALMTPVNDPEAIAQAIISLLRDASLCEHLASNAQIRSRENFSISRMIESYAQQYKNYSA